MKKNFYKPNKRVKRIRKKVGSAKAIHELSVNNNILSQEDIKSEVPVKSPSKPEKRKKNITLREYEQSYLRISRSQRKKKLWERFPLQLLIVFLLAFTVLHRS